MYFRGPVLSTFDGREWLALPAQPHADTQLTSGLEVQGPAVSYQVTLEPHNQPWILVLDATPAKPALPAMRATMTPDLQWLANRPVTDLIRYTARSHTQFRHGPLVLRPGLHDYLTLPANFNPRTQQLANSIRSDPRNANADTPALIEAVMERLRTGGYLYTLEPGVFGTHTADEFWFDRKQGFCEHIASSFVLLMRAMGIPARIVTGYQGGNFNTIDGYWTVRQSDAHAWTEVWVAGQGWLRVDPTSAVSPARTGSFVRLEAPRSAIVAALSQVSPQFSLNLRALWDAANNRWNQWVLNYTQNQQLNLLRNLGFESPSWEDLGYLLIGLVVAASLGAATWTLWERHRQDPWLRLLERAAQRLRSAGLPLAPHTPPRQMAALLRQRHSGLQPICDWLLRLEAWRYAPHAHTLQLATLQREFRHLPWPPKIP
jgi:transglutaminase-like putative cysteine protease